MSVVDGNYAYVADRTSGLAIIDVSNPASPGTPVYMDTSGSAYGVTVVGNYAYVADYASGLAIINISNPTSPGGPSYVPLNYQGATGYSEDVDIVDNYAYVSVDGIGLAVFPLNTSSIQDAVREQCNSNFT
jgi:hypothetical protein